jgi:cytochrome c-type biogenesis protein CcmF
MIAEIGNLALVLALVVVVLQTILPLTGARIRQYRLIAIAAPAARTQLLLVAVSYACLTTSFIQSDFSVAYVANNSNSLLPLIYRISGVWGAHEGSLLLWALILAAWTAAVSIYSRHVPAAMLARVLGVMGFISIGFISFILFTSNPFDRLIPAPLEGRDLNPLLQDIGLAIHPPMLYMGYVGFSVAFAFAIAALLSGRLDAAWTRWMRPWTNVAWLFLTLGIALGSWWAYYELGWGGWWFWDPVENASFLPWLVGTALIHSLAVTEKRNVFKAWTVLLAVSAFSLSLLGTFLVRSGVLTSVHAFATDPTRGLYILIFLVVVVGGSLALYAWRAHRCAAPVSSNWYPGKVPYWSTTSCW